MDYKYIEQLLERYWNCETSLEEEQILRAFFSQKDVPAGLMKYKDLFVYEQAETKDDVLGTGFDARMAALVGGEEPARARKASLAQKFMPLFKAAAVVAIFLTLGNAAQVAFKGGGKPETGVAVYEKAHEGPSVALGDTAKADTLKKLPQATDAMK